MFIVNTCCTSWCRSCRVNAARPKPTVSPAADSEREKSTYTEYASYPARSGDEQFRGLGEQWTAYLAAMLLPPSEDTALPIATTHKPVDLLAIQTLRPCAISQAVALFEVDAMLMKQV